MISISKTILRFISISVLSFLLPARMLASDIEMADVMRSNGMIYVVITVLSIIFLGIVVFLLIIERRLKKLENQDKK